MVPFAGYEMPVQYRGGIINEHLHTRAAAGLFDVSHMGQIRVVPNSGNLADAALAVERVAPINILGLNEGRQRYGLFTNPNGGILDDFMVARHCDQFLIVANASRKSVDFDLLASEIGRSCGLELLEDRALIAIQGPAAVAALEGVVPGIAELSFMESREFRLDGSQFWISRSGYTGEDGFEISVPADGSEQFFARLLEQEGVVPVGLGARDSLRLEAGLCLFGNDIDETTSPVEAALEWAVPRGWVAFPVMPVFSPNSKRERPAAGWAFVRREGRRCAEVRSCMRTVRVEFASARLRRAATGRPLAVPFQWAMSTPATELTRCPYTARSGDECWRRGSGRCRSSNTATSRREVHAVKFTEEHEWLVLDGDVVTVGITDFAVEQLGDIVFVELPEPDAEVDAEEDIAVVESVKAASDVYAPASGTIVEVNQAIVDNPALVNDDPQGEGWFFRMKLADPADYDGFLDEEEYRGLTK